MIAYNNLERIVFMLIINIGDILFAFAFSLIASIQFHIAESNEFQVYLAKIKRIEEFLEAIKVDDG